VRWCRWSGTAPTNFNFVSGDYNRKTGLVGDGSTKYLDSNRAGNADPQNSFHLSTYSTTATTLLLLAPPAAQALGTAWLVPQELTTLALLVGQ
jgi:hypothetical protein